MESITCRVVALSKPTTEKPFVHFEDYCKKSIISRMARIGQTRVKEDKPRRMQRKFIPAEESFGEWNKDPNYVATYDALENEFALASALIEARSKANMTQEEVAAAMGTTQAVVARLESGKTLPSTRTLDRFARATRTRLRISFESRPESVALKR